MSVKKDTMECYRVRGGHGGHEWATIGLTSWSRPVARHDGQPDMTYYCGEILIYSGFGSWGNAWYACGVPFKQFLIGAEFDYVFTKFMGSKLRVFDGPGSFRELQRKVLRARLDGDFTKPVARELWTELLNVSEEAQHSEESWVRAMGDVVEACGRGDVHHFLAEPWDMTHKVFDRSASSFWRDLWPAFVGQLKAETAPTIQQTEGASA